jgi:hypothetical protein
MRLDTLVAVPVCASARLRFRLWLLHKAVSEKLVGDRGDGPQRGWL